MQTAGLVLMNILWRQCKYYCQTPARSIGVLRHTGSPGYATVSVLELPLKTEANFNWTFAILGKLFQRLLAGIPVIGPERINQAAKWKRSERTPK